MRLSRLMEHPVTIRRISPTNQLTTSSSPILKEEAGQPMVDLNRPAFFWLSS